MLDSIKSKVLWGCIAAAGVVIVAGGTTVYHLTKRDFYNQVDAAMEQRDELLKSKVIVWGFRDPRPILAGRPSPDEEGEPDDFGLFHVSTVGGETIASASAFEGAAAAGLSSIPPDGTIREFTARDGPPLRVMASTFTVAQMRPPSRRNRDERDRRDSSKDDANGRGDSRDRQGRGDDRRPEWKPAQFDIRLVVAEDVSEIETALGHLRLLLGGVGLGTFIALAAAIHFVVRDALTPLTAIATELKQRDESSLNTDLADDEKMPTEVRPLVDSFNGLLARIRHSFDRERRFTSSAAHELRTPLAGITTRLEQTLRRPRSREEYETAISKSLNTAQSMNAMVERLLSLARFGSASVVPEIGAVDVDALIDSSLEDFRDRLDERQLTLEKEVPEDIVVQTDAALVQILINNLVENAVSYADEGGRVGIIASEDGDGGGFDLTIDNSGNCLTNAEAKRVFEPFWRGDNARTDAAVHAGLGLSICQRVVDLLGGTIQATAENGTFRMNVRIPPVSKN